MIKEVAVLGAGAYLGNLVVGKFVIDMFSKGDVPPSKTITLALNLAGMGIGAYFAKKVLG